MTNVKNLGVIPARFASTRFPGKPLASIGGKPMIQRVYEQALKSELDEVVVATDHESIAKTVEGFGGRAVMTDPNLPSGTDRCRAALIQLDFDPEFIINIQGDEPFIDPDQINQVLSVLEKEGAEIATLVTPASESSDIDNPNRVKAVLSKSGRVLYFSRHGIPFQRGEKGFDIPHYIHLGIYGYRNDVLKEITTLAPSHLETMESLEQLRWLENDFSIFAGLTDSQAESVDTPEDLMMIEKKYFL